MAFFRISELAPAVLPVPAAALLEISEPDASAISGYDSRQVTVSDFFTDITLGGDILIPTAPPGSNNNLAASTEYVDTTVNNSQSWVNGNFLPLTGGMLSGQMTAPTVAVTNEYQILSRGGPSEYWSLYVQDDAFHLWGGADRFTVSHDGDATVTRNLTVSGTSNLNGYVTAADFRSNLNVWAPNGWGHFGGDVQGSGATFGGGGLTVYGNIHATGSLTIDQGSVAAWFHADGHISAGTGGNQIDIFDDGNSHIESNTALWLNSNGNQILTWGTLTINRNSAGPGDIPLKITQVNNNYSSGLAFRASGGPQWIVGTAGHSSEYDAYWGSYFIYTGDFPYSSTGLKMSIDVDGNCLNVSGSWGSLSDAGLKQDIESFDAGLASLAALRPVRFRYRPGTPFAPKEEPSAKLIGLLADNVREHLPEITSEVMAVVDGEVRKVAAISPGLLVYVLINSCKELAEKDSALEARLVALEGAQ